MTMTADEVRAVVDAILEKLRPVVERGIAEYVAPAKRRVGATPGKLVRIVQRADWYAGSDRYGQLCAQKLMPHSKLLKLSRMTAQDFWLEIDQAIAAGQIEVCRDPASGLRCYRAKFPQTAPQPDLAALDDPEQDSHTWDFGKALERARLEREI